MPSKGSGIRVINFDRSKRISSFISHSTLEPIETYTKLSPCTSSIKQKSKDKIFIIITTSVEERVLQTFESIQSIEAILILSTIQQDINTFPSKVFGIYFQPETLFQSLTKLQETLEVQLNARSFISNRLNDDNDKSSFFFYYTWQNKAKHSSNSKAKFISKARSLYRSKKQIQRLINDFETFYTSQDVLLWLDKERHLFPYHLLISNALRTHNENILSLTRFFIHDLDKQLKSSPLGTKQNQVYFGTKLSIDRVNELEQISPDDLIAFQCFLPTTRSISAALYEATQTTRRHDLINVLFKIDINDAFYTNIGNAILIEMATMFHVLCVTKTTVTGGGQQSLTIVKLSALSQDETNTLVEEFLEKQKQLEKPKNNSVEELQCIEKDAETLADEFMQEAKWSEAANMLSGIENPSARVLNKHGCLLRERLNNISDSLVCHKRAIEIANDREKAETLIYLGLTYKEMGEHDQSFDVYNQALEWFENEKPRNLTMIARCLVGLGNAQWARRNLDEALDFAEQALSIRENEIKPVNNCDIAVCLGNIGNIYRDLGDRERALTYAKRAVDLLSASGDNDIRFAAALNNLAAMHRVNGDLVNARKYFQQALESLPNENHPFRKLTLANIARLDAAEESMK